MAFVALTRWLGSRTAIRSGTAQANTGQTDWISVPAWAKSAVIELRVSAVAGTTPLIRVATLKSVSPNLQAVGTANAGKLDDTGAITLVTVTSGADLGASVPAQSRVSFGPGIAPADTLTTTDAEANGVLPDILGIEVLADRTTGDETYTYSVFVDFRPF